MSSSRRCALPGCYVVIEPAADGRPQRKYCTAAHRAVARQARREGTNRSASAPPLLMPELPLPPLAPTPESGPARRRRVLAEAAGRRARAMAVLGSAGLLVTGGTLMVSSAPQPSAAVATPWLSADPKSEQQWAQDARVSLASLDRQLADIDEAEQSWNALPAAERGDRAPATVRALSQRRALLQQQRTSIASELASFEALHDLQQKLEDTERHVASLDRALSEVPRHRDLSPAEQDASRRLSEQRSLRDKQRQSQQQELDGLTEGLREAMATPLPADDAATHSITSAVRELVKDPAKGRDRQSERPLDAQRPQPEVATPQERSEPGHQEVGAGAPQVPGHDRPEAPRQPDVLAAPPVPHSGGILDSVRKLPGLGGGAAATPSPAGPAIPAGPSTPGRSTTPGQGGGLLGGLTRGGGANPATPSAPGTPVSGTPGVPGGGVLDGGQEHSRGEVPVNGRGGPAGGAVGQAVGTTGQAAGSVTGAVGDVVGGGTESAPHPGDGPPDARPDGGTPNVGAPESTPRTTPAVPEVGVRQVDFNGPGADQAWVGYDAADTVLSGLPLGDGVKDRARLAVAEELRSQQHSGELSDYVDPTVAESTPERSSSSESRRPPSSSSSASAAQEETAHEALRDLGFESSGSGDPTDVRSSSGGGDTIDRMIDSYGGSSLADSGSDDRSDSDSDSGPSDSDASQAAAAAFSGDIGDLVDRYRSSGDSHDSGDRYRSSSSDASDSNASDSGDALREYFRSGGSGSDDSGDDD